jgi:hypothetical protein
VNLYRCTTILYDGKQQQQKCTIWNSRPSYVLLSDSHIQFYGSAMGDLRRYGMGSKILGAG